MQDEKKRLDCSSGVKDEWKKSGESGEKRRKRFGDIKFLIMNRDHNYFNFILLILSI